MPLVHEMTSQFGRSYIVLCIYRISRHILYVLTLISLTPTYLNSIFGNLNRLRILWTSLYIHWALGICHNVHAVRWLDRVHATLHILATFNGTSYIWHHQTWYYKIKLQFRFNLISPLFGLYSDNSSIKYKQTTHTCRLCIYNKHTGVTTEVGNCEPHVQGYLYSVYIFMYI